MTLMPSSFLIAVAFLENPFQKRVRERESLCRFFINADMNTHIYVLYVIDEHDNAKSAVAMVATTSRLRRLPRRCLRLHRNLCYHRLLYCQSSL